MEKEGVIKRFVEVLIKKREAFPKEFLCFYNRARMAAKKRNLEKCVENAIRSVKSLPEDLRFIFYWQHNNPDKIHFREVVARDRFNQIEEDREKILDYAYQALTEDPTNPIFYEKLIWHYNALHRQGLSTAREQDFVRFKTNKLFAAAMSFKDPRLRIVNENYDNTELALSLVIQRTEDRETSRKRHMCAEFIRRNNNDKRFPTLESRGFVELEGEWYSISSTVSPENFGVVKLHLGKAKIYAPEGIFFHFDSRKIQNYSSFLKDKTMKEKKEEVKRIIDSLVNIQEIFRRNDALGLGIRRYDYREKLEKRFLDIVRIDFKDWQLIELLEKQKRIFGHCDLYPDNILVADKEYPCIIDFAKASWVNPYFDLAYLLEQKSLDFGWKEKGELASYFIKKTGYKGGDELYFHNALLVDLLGMRYQKLIGERDGYYSRKAIEMINALERKGYGFENLRSELHRNSGLG